MDELVDILNKDGSHTGERLMKSEAHQSGLYHPTVHIWFYTSNGLVLIQKRGRKKKSFPLLWDVSVAGHIGAGESVLATALRETEEEIGLTIRESDLYKIGVYKSEQTHNQNFKDFEFHHCFIAPLEVPLKELKKQDSEVEELRLIPLIRLAEDILGLANRDIYVPHQLSYYKDVISAIRNALKGFDETTGLA